MLAFAGCALFYFVGGDSNLLALIAVFFFFLMHGLRDEVFFYRLRSGKAISDEEYPHVYRLLIWLQVAGLCLLGGVLYPVFIYKLAIDPSHVQFNLWLNTLLPSDWPLGLKMLASATPFIGVGAFAVARIQRQQQGGLFNLLMSHPPLSIILVATISIALSSIVAGMEILNFIVLIHFTGWFIFATKSISSQPKAVQQAATWRQPNQVDSREHAWLLGLSRRVGGTVFWIRRHEPLGFRPAAADDRRPDALQPADGAVWPAQLQLLDNRSRHAWLLTEAGREAALNQPLRCRDDALGRSAQCSAAAVSSKSPNLWCEVITKRDAAASLC